MSIVDLVVFCNDVLIVLGQDVFGNLLKISLEILSEILQNVSSIGLEVKLEEHVMCDYDG